jgi:hypothetical protein
MWVLAALWIAGKRRLAVNIVLAWLAVMGFALAIAGPGQIYLQAAAPDSPYVYAGPLWAPYAATLGGVAALIIVGVVLAERADRKKATA